MLCSRIEQILELYPVWVRCLMSSTKFLIGILIFSFGWVAADLQVEVGELRAQNRELEKTLLEPHLIEHVRVDQVNLSLGAVHVSEDIERESVELRQCLILKRDRELLLCGGG
jgi:hypothetical protein